MLHLRLLIPYFVCHLELPGKTQLRHTTSLCHAGFFRACTWSLLSAHALPHRPALLPHRGGNGPHSGLGGGRWIRGPHRAAVGWARLASITAWHHGRRQSGDSTGAVTQGAGMFMGGWSAPSTRTPGRGSGGTVGVH